MATKRMLKAVATAFIPLGEDSEGVQQYSVYPFYNVAFRASAGSKRNSVDSSKSDSLVLYIFDTTSKTPSGNIPTVCENIFYVIKGGIQVVADLSSIYVVPYDASTATRPPSGALRIDSVSRFKAGSRRMWHWKVEVRWAR